MKVLAIVAAALLRFVRERSNVFFVFILPLGIILLIGVQFGGEFRPTVGVHLAPGAGAVGAEVVRILGATDEVEVRTYDTEAALVDAVERGGLAAGVALPGDLEATLAAGGAGEIGFVARPDGTGPQLAVVVQEAVAAATDTIAAARAAAGLGVDPSAALELATSMEDAVSEITVATRTTGEELFAGVEGRFDTGAAGQLVLFTFLTGLAGSADLIQSRTLGVTRRIMGTPTSVGTIVTGEAMGRFAVVFTQALYILVATLLLFRIDWGDPVAAAAILVTFSAVGAGAAMLMGALFRNDAQAGSVGGMAGIGLAGIGGAMLPLELFSPTMQTVARFTPHAWALDAFAETVRRDGTVVDILPQLGVLTAFAVVLIAVASWRMRLVVTRV
ncbi:MAG: ABC transporter permease [Actinomycetota bacterium]|nr:ABC transporter permease [Actinomycetota bacterium]